MRPATVDMLDGLPTPDSRKHPYLAGNFAPIQKTVRLTPCSFSGTIPEDLAGGQYVRNGGNPLVNDDLKRNWHWFDGDGMLSGVLFERSEAGGIQPAFTNQYVLTDVFLSSLSTSSITRPVLPSIATMVDPLASVLKIMLHIMRTIYLVILSRLPTRFTIKKISVANTSIVYHDGRALATCESGPPMRVQLPELTTVGWFDGWKSGNEPGELPVEIGLGGQGIFSFMREWTTAHPKVDPETRELILYHSTFIPPFIRYGVVPSTSATSSILLPRLLNAPVPGVQSPKMMHDFGVSRKHTVIMDLPLSLNPFNLLRGRAILAYDPWSTSRFGVFPRMHPDRVRWFETNACLIFHAANSWDEHSKDDAQEVVAVNMLGCRLTTATLVYSAGDVIPPTPKSLPPNPEEEQCRLYYYRFSLAEGPNTITHQFSLSAIPFEFPTVRESVAMSEARYVYGCSLGGGSFGAALGRAVKIDTLVKIDVHTLVQRGQENPPEQVRGCVDTRIMEEVLSSKDPSDPVKAFRLPEGWYAQEPRFVPRKNGTEEDDGWILSYVFDESQLDHKTQECPDDAESELWIIDAKNMKDVVARIQLPQRVPYGLHGNWFGEDMINEQRPVERTRTVEDVDVARENVSLNRHRRSSTKKSRKDFVKLQ